MATRSFIAMKTKNGYIGAYCHWDGYLTGVGQTLRDHYTTIRNVRNLITNGDMSSIGMIVGEKHDFNDRVVNKETDEYTQTTYYHRDRGEDWEHTKFAQVETLDELRNHAEEYGTEYLYLFEGRTWKFTKRGAQFFGGSNGQAFGEFQSLKRALRKV